MNRVKLLIFSFFFFSILSPLLTNAQIVEYSWQRVRMDSTFNSNGKSKVDKIISKYSGAMGDLMDVLGYTKEEMAKAYPESSLSNLAADMIIHAVSDYIADDEIVLSITNFGGIRSNIPKGPVRVYDIYSVFPFDNRLVIIDVLGRNLKTLLDRFASRSRFEAMGGVEFVVEGGKFTKCLIGGLPLDPEKIYKLVTIDFLLDGGDSLKLGELAENIDRTDIFMRDAATDYIKYLTSRGVTLDDKGDGRIIIK